MKTTNRSTPIDQLYYKKRLMQLYAYTLDQGGHCSFPELDTHLCQHFQKLKLQRKSRKPTQTKASSAASPSHVTPTPSPAETNKPTPDPAPKPGSVGDRSEPPRKTEPSPKTELSVKAEPSPKTEQPRVESITANTVIFSPMPPKPLGQGQAASELEKQLKKRRAELKAKQTYQKHLFETFMQHVQQNGECEAPDLMQHLVNQNIPLKILNQADLSDNSVTACEQALNHLRQDLRSSKMALSAPQAHWQHNQHPASLRFIAQTLHHQTHWIIHQLELGLVLHQSVLHAKVRRSLQRSLTMLAKSSRRLWRSWQGQRYWWRRQSLATALTQLFASLEMWIGQCESHLALFKASIQTAQPATA